MSKSDVRKTVIAYQPGAPKQQKNIDSSLIASSTAAGSRKSIRR